jgi:adenylyltransferase/sulfurtransferase
MPNEPQDSDVGSAAGRYSRQALLPEIGGAGQRRLAASRAVLIGCGALGSDLANTLVRAGVGHLRIVDRDFIELNNLQRQALFDEADIAAGLPKAEAAARKLRTINSGVAVEAVVADANHKNVAELCDGAEVLLDGTDNFDTRYLLNDLAVQSGRPWVYGAVIGTSGLAMPIVPGETPCLRCVFPEPPPPEVSPTCDTAGVLGPAVSLVAAFQAIEALKLLMGRPGELTRRLLSIDAWTGRLTALDVSASKIAECPCCGRRDFEYLDGRRGSAGMVLCGRNAVQVSRPGSGAVDFARIGAKLSAVADGPPTINRFMLRARVGAYELAVFADGRAIVTGTSSIDEARSVYAKYVGS